MGHLAVKVLQGSSASAAKMKAIKHLSEAQETPVFTQRVTSELTRSSNCKREITHHSVFQVQKKNQAAASLEIP